MHYRRIELCNGHLQQWDITSGSRNIIFYTIIINFTIRRPSQFSATINSQNNESDYFQNNHLKIDQYKVFFTNISWCKTIQPLYLLDPETYVIAFLQTFFQSCPVDHNWSKFQDSRLSRARWFPTVPYQAYLAVHPFKD